jgi:hypothetical protein
LQPHLQIDTRTQPPGVTPFPLAFDETDFLEGLDDIANVGSNAIIEGELTVEGVFEAFVDKFKRTEVVK